MGSSRLIILFAILLITSSILNRSKAQNSSSVIYNEIKRCGLNKGKISIYISDSVSNLFSLGYKIKCGKRRRLYENTSRRFIDTLSNFFSDTSNFENEGLIASCSFYPTIGIGFVSKQGEKIYLLVSLPCNKIVLSIQNISKSSANVYLKKEGLKKFMDIVNSFAPALKI